MNPSVGKHTVGHALGLATHLAKDRAGGDLGKQPNTHPVGEALGIPLKRRIAFGVGKNGAHTGQAQLVEGFVEVRGEPVVREFNEEVVATVQRVLLGVGDGILHIVVAEMKVAARGDCEGNGLRGEGRTQGADTSGDLGRIEGIDIIGVGRGNHMGYPVVCGDAGHSQRGLQVGRSVVEARKQMMVKIDHTAMPEYHRARILDGEQIAGHRQPGEG